MSYPAQHAAMFLYEITCPGRVMRSVQGNSGGRNLLMEIANNSHRFVRHNVLIMDQLKALFPVFHEVVLSSETCKFLPKYK